MQGEPVRIPLDDLTALLAKPVRRSKLTAQQDEEIAKLSAEGATLRELAARYSVSHEAVRSAIKRAQ